MKVLGICIGASNLGVTLIESINENLNILDEYSISHEGNPRKIIENIINDDFISEIDKIVVTGKKIRHSLNVTSISEPEAIEYAYHYLSKKQKLPNLIISAGGENFIIYKVDDKGKIMDVYTGNKCASGTGEFFLQQIKRMNLNIDDAISIADVESPYLVAGRCSVFCKSDCTHALNKGTSKASVIAGLCKMMATKILELLKAVDYNEVILIGGVAKNKPMVHYLEKQINKIVVPKSADNFEALGAALWGLNHNTLEVSVNNLFRSKESNFKFFNSLAKFEKEVVFKELKFEKSNLGDRCILGLDVGSTTTKAVLLRISDDAIIANVYLRTNGDPIGASIMCYKEVKKQLNHNVEIIGIGVTGSGRQIAGLHALTEGIINEITAHARGAIHFDEEVDTIFEIGGQDAKYTYLTNGVPSDYAMNEACSAGTGSFLEESAKESLGIEMIDISDIAYQSKRPPNFSDQCSAFIGSDIKNAIQEGIERKDIVAGLVYSIAQNYINRVKGNRKVGNKIFMQGGVCYNKSVPLAMAALTGKKIIVPPHPGLIGAFGVSLVIKDKINRGLIDESLYDLDDLIGRNVIYKKPFICRGGVEVCNRKCKINRLEIKGNTYSFGGACNKYYNILQTKNNHNKVTDLVKLREQLVFRKYCSLKDQPLVAKQNKKVGINNSLLAHTYYPLYSKFFTALGFDVIKSEEVDKTGIEKKGSSFCYPVEIAHGSMASLIEKQPDIYFLPHIKAIHTENGNEHSYACPFVQGEAYYLRTAFKQLKNKYVLSPVLTLNDDFTNVKKPFLKMGKKLGFKKQIVDQAFNQAIKKQIKFNQECKEIGKTFLEEIEQSGDIAIVVFGRPYNGFTTIANMGIPQKFTSRGYRIIPYDFLPFTDEKPYESMYWAMGQNILKASKVVKRHPQLFGVYITNFSCGPDSFIINYFRDIMKEKPSLTLELDSHTADAGIDTRIEAYIDVVKSFMEGYRRELIYEKSFNVAQTIMKKGQLKVIDSNNIEREFTDPLVKLYIPTMGDVGGQLLTSLFKYVGVNAISLDAPNEIDFRQGAKHVSCKECLPLVLTAGSLWRVIEERKNDNEVILYFMPEASGPCRFGQYNVLMKNIVEKNSLKNVAFLSLTSENGYLGFGNHFAARAWQVVLMADIFEDIYSAILALSENIDEALEIYNGVVKNVIKSFAILPWKELKKVLADSVDKLNEIEIKKPLEMATKVALVGEIYVRRDEYSRGNIVERLAKRGIITKVAPVAEWMYYLDYLTKNKLLVGSTLGTRTKQYAVGFIKKHFENVMKTIFNKCQFYQSNKLDVDTLVDNTEHLISSKLTGEAILTIGGALHHIIDDVAGVISIGPFGCMPSRISEAIIKGIINSEKINMTHNIDLTMKVLEAYPNLPFLPIETDGNQYPPIIESKIETFCLQVDRVHEKILNTKYKI